MTAVDDYVIEVRDINLVRQGAISPKDILELTLTPLVNAVGAWSLKIAADHPLAAVLNQPGSGIVATSPYDVFSGPTTAPETIRGTDDRAGTITFNGVDDNIVLWDKLAYPEPDNSNTTTQDSDYDERTGKAETVMHQYVNANIGPLGTDARRVNTLTLGPDGGRGQTIKKQARFEVIGDLLAGIANAEALRFRVVQRGSGLSFETEAARDFTKEIRLDIDTGTLDGHRLAIAAPTATHAIVGAANVTLDRVFATVTTPDSVTASDLWGRRIERFVDQNYVLDTEAFTQSARELLATEGITTIVATGIPQADSRVIFGRDWTVGDKVSIVIGDQELPSIVTGSVTKIDSSGVVVGAVLGDATGFSPQAKAARTAKRTDQRVSRLERQGEIGIAKKVQEHSGNWSGLNGTTLPEIYAQANVIANAAAVAAYTATLAQQTANGKNTVTYSNNAPGSTLNIAGDIWFQRDGLPLGSIIAQFEGMGGTTWEPRLLSSAIIANLDAGKITAGTAFINALQVLTNFTLGGYDADGNYQSGVIQSFNFANRPTGVLITENGIVAKGGSFTAAEFFGGTFRGGNFIGGQLTGMGLSTDIQGGRQLDISSSGLLVVKDGAAKIFLNDTGGYFYVPVSAPAVNADAIRSYGVIDADSVVTGSQLYARGQTGPAGEAPVMAMFTPGGGLVRGGASSLEVKQDVEHMTVEFAEKLLDLEPVTARYKAYPDADPLPMFITEQAAAVGAETWVTRDENGKPDGFRYVETTPAIVRLLQHQRDELRAEKAAMRDEIAELRAEKEAMRAELDEIRQHVGLPPAA